MVAKDSKSTGSPNVQVGEIDTRAPFQSVKDALNMFGEGAFSEEKPVIRKARLDSAEAKVKVKELCSSGNTQSAEQLPVSSDTPHNSFWLLGRQIWEQITSEMDKKMRSMINKLVEKNQDLKVDVDELCAEPSNAISSDDENVTP